MFPSSLFFLISSHLIYSPLHVSFLSSPYLYSSSHLPLLFPLLFPIPFPSHHVPQDMWYATPLSEIDFSQCRKCTPSYRALPKSYPKPVCSERNEVEASLLNDVVCKSVVYYFWMFLSWIFYYFFLDLLFVFNEKFLNHNETPLSSLPYSSLFSLVHSSLLILLSLPLSLHHYLPLSLFNSLSGWAFLLDQKNLIPSDL